MKEHEAVNCNYRGRLEFIRQCLDVGNFQRARSDLRQLLTFIPADPSKVRARNTDPTTSHIGASLPQSGNRKLVLDAVTAAGAGGLTSYELSSNLGFKAGLHRRLSELERQGFLVRVDITRESEYGVPNAVYIAASVVKARTNNYDPIESTLTPEINE